MGILQIFKNSFKVPELRKKLFMTLVLILIFRIGCFIPVPGLSESALSSLAGSGLFQFMDILSGGAFENVSIFAMGISPYINASIIMQLLTVAIPYFERLQKEGGEGRKKINKITRYVTVGLAIFQGVMLYINLNNSGSAFTEGLGTGKAATVLLFLTILFSFTAGTAILTWLGEKITEVGIGNGISMIIFAGIISRLPDAIKTFISIIVYGSTTWGVDYKDADAASKISDKLYVTIPFIVAVVLVFLAVIVAVVWMDGGERRLPVQYAKRVVGRKMLGGQSTHIPLKVNSSGVLPIIFAMSLLQFPVTIASFINANSGITKSLNDFTGTWWYLIIYAALIVGFTFFYNIVYFDPNEIANNLKNNGGMIMGASLRPGKPTADYIKGISTRITWFGAFFLAVLAVLPSLIQKIIALFSPSLGNFNMWFGGTSVLIVVGVAIETVRQLEAQLLMRHYKGGKGGFLD
ncbi:MAG: preprotein translocase subunit SecY [Ruminococcaceae bacterium]|nr:preprotein translocase subunit SecY [Oscillospiraceae bacterium]